MVSLSQTQNPPFSDNGSKWCYDNNSNVHETVTFDDAKFVVPDGTRCCHDDKLLWAFKAVAQKSLKRRSYVGCCLNVVNYRFIPYSELQSTNLTWSILLLAMQYKSQGPLTFNYM